MGELERTRALRNSVLRRTAATTVGARATSLAALLVITPLLAHELGIERYGVMVTLTSTAAILGIADFGIANGLISKLAASGWESPRTRSLVSAAEASLLAASAVGVVAAILLTWGLPWPTWLNAPSIADADLRWATLFALLGVALTLTTGLGQKMDLSRQRGHAVALWGSAASLAGPAGALVTSFSTSSLPLVVAAAALLPPLVLSLQTIAAIRSLPPHLRPSPAFAKREDVTELLRSGGVFVGLAVVIAASFQIDTLIVSSILGASAAALFSVVVRLFGLVGTTIQSSLTQLWAAFAEALSRDDVHWVKRTLIRTAAGAGGIALAVNLGLVFVGQRLVETWLGPGFHPTVGLLVAAGLWSAYSTAIHPLAMFLNGSQMQRTQLVAALPMAVVNVALSIYLARRIGSQGPLIGSLIAHVVCAGVPLGLVARRRLRTLERAANGRLARDVSLG